jgi:hypothetical protein
MGGWIDKFTIHYRCQIVEVDINPKNYSRMESLTKEGIENEVKFEFGLLKFLRDELFNTMLNTVELKDYLTVYGMYLKDIPIEALKDFIEENNLQKVGLEENCSNLVLTHPHAVRTYFTPILEQGINVICHRNQGNIVIGESLL